MRLAVPGPAAISAQHASGGDPAGELLPGCSTECAILGVTAREIQPGDGELDAEPARAIVILADSILLAA